jgi:hypothetical protein
MERLVPHRTRVIVAGRGAGMVVRVENSRVVPVNGGRATTSIPARVHVVLDDGGRVAVAPGLLTVEDVAA